MNLKQLSELSGITLKHLEHFSHGRFEMLPPTPYLHGYFQRLGAILGFDPTDWWNRVRGEVQTSGKGDVMVKNRYAIRRRGIWFVVLIVLILAGFFGLRASQILGKPQIELTAPPASLARVSEDHVIFAGKITNADEIVINDEQIPHEDDGTFRKDVPLQPGMNNVEVRARKVLGRETKITRQIYYDASDSFIPEVRTSTSSQTQATTTQL